MLEGDNICIFKLFSELSSQTVRLLLGCGLPPKVGSQAAVEEFTSYVVEKRRQHADSDRIPNTMEFLLRDFAFQSRHYVFRAYKMCSSLVIELPRSSLSRVNFHLPGGALNPGAFDRCTHLVQSYVLSAGYGHQPFLTNPTLDAVRDALSNANAGVFFVAAHCDLWAGLCDPAYEEFAYNRFLSELRKFGECYYVKCNCANRVSQLEQRASSSIQGSHSYSVTNPKKGTNQQTITVERRTTSGSKITGKGGSQNGMPKNDNDPDVFRMTK